jgi:hypothetical protein
MTERPDYDPHAYGVCAGYGECDRCDAERAEREAEAEDDRIERTPEDRRRFHEDMRTIRRSRLLREEGVE